METLNDIREALAKIPVDVLEKCQFGIGENTEDNVSLIYMDEDYALVFEKYPDLTKISNLVNNIKKAQEIMNSQNKAEELSEQLQEEGVTDTFFDKKE